MVIPSSYSFVRYLSSKKSVDDRGLNPHVMQSLIKEGRCRLATSRLDVLELGAGIGTMAERFLQWILAGEVTYTALDSESELIAEAGRRLIGSAVDHGFAVEEEGRGSIRFFTEDKNLRLKLVHSDIFDFLPQVEGREKWDLLIANAFLDLMNLSSMIPRLFSLLRPGGLYYFTINFDGATIFEPEIDRELDRLVEILYHETMDRRVTAGRPSGDSRTGRHLFGELRAAGGQILAAGASDWVVFSGPEGYPGDEAYFLHHIVDTVRMALQGRPELDPARFAQWIDRRHAQIEEGTLVYIAHQLDFFGCI